MNLPKIYEPEQYESDIYQLWLDSGAFRPSGKGEPYSIIMPPPNANGDLHAGHALGTALEDILIRYHRMLGHKTVWLPGEDHAGFETWVVYERKLEQTGKSRFDFTRDELYKQVWDFVAENRGNMTNQLKRLGASCDWDSLTFTLDPNVIAVAYQTFHKMWQDDMIYRSERIVNYCTKHDTSFSDIEVVYKDEKSHLWDISYPLSDGSGEIIVATTRPETMLGDTAIAVHPDDERYTKFVGKTVRLPLSNREIPIVADEMVEREFGTGAVKITPAHDPNDFETSQRHNLPAITIIGYDGKITAQAPDKYQGLTVDEARKSVVKDLKSQGFLVKEEKFKHSVGHCYKCGTVIEPLLKDQWFVRMDTLAERAIEAIKSGKIKFYPDNKAKVLVNYLKDLRDWNISRQIPWGIPIPAFQNVANSSDWIFDDRVDREVIEKNGQTYRRDPDTFDTWFSSGQWPYITTIFNQAGGLKDFYPTSVMETGHDILFQWVGRMIMLGLYVTGDVPFKEVYLHGMVQDEHGQKMSKSKGNVVNPMVFVDKYGSDALRLGITANRSAGQNQAFGDATVKAGRNFCNKLWNMARFIDNEMNEDSSGGGDEAGQNTIADDWALSQLAKASIDIGNLLQKYRFSEAYERLYHVIWDDIADWYIEASKSAYRRSTLVKVLETCLKLAHPFAPFVTETIWQTLDWTDGQLITQAWPKSDELAFNATQATKFEDIKAIVTETRNLTSILGSSEIALAYQDDEVLADNAELIRRLTKVAYVRPTKDGHALKLTSSNRDIWFDITDEQRSYYQTEVVKAVQKLQEQRARLQQRLDNKSYVDNAPKDLVEQSRAGLANIEQQIIRLDSELANLQ